jgi:asparagine synthase (glutamine-hydrolysing)
MCGIAGYVSRSGQPAVLAVLQAMANSIAHRGPDGEGFFTDGTIGLAHRRLAIIDTSAAGHQPMETGDARFVLTYNGEVYNFREIRAELQSCGYIFRSNTDTEVVLNALAEWGTSAFSKFNGMFALALWDRRERVLLLARDRYGIKPLYFSQQNSAFVFGSEVKAILVSQFAESRINLAGLYEYMTFQNFFTESTLFANIDLLPAGTWLRYEVDGHKISTQSYWDFDFSEPATAGSRSDYADELEGLFEQAVARHLISDVPLGGFLSGGIDSGAIVSVGARHIQNFNTFTVGFEMRSASGLELAFDEREKAEHMSYLFGTEHYEMVLKSGDMERAMSSLVSHMEEPRIGQSYPNYYASKLASKFVKVALAGTGGDELFGGYPWRYYRAVVNTDFEDYVDKYYLYWQRLVPNSVLQKMCAPIWSDVKHVWTRDIFRDRFARHSERLTRPEDYVNHSLYLEAKTFLHSLLIVEDKLSMAHGLESRVPFLDNDLVDFAMTLPVKLKLGNLGEVVRLNENEPGLKASKYYEKTHDGKLLLREVMARKVPSYIAGAAKQGFSAPDASWFRGESIDYVSRRIMDPRARIYELFDWTTVRGLVQEHLEGKENRRLLIWSLLHLEEWLEKFA